MKFAAGAFLADALLLTSLLAVVGEAGASASFPLIWVPVVFLLAWAARERTAGSRGRSLDLATGLLSLSGLSLLAKLEITPARLLLTGGVALAYALLVAPAIHVGLRRSPRTVGAAILLVVALLGAWRLGLRERFDRPVPPVPVAGAKSLLLISIDTTRVDSLGCYGAPWNTSPTLDRIANEGALFEMAIAQAPHTHSSMASLLTSKYPIEHGSLREYYVLDEEHETLAEHLHNQGYRTAAFLDNPWLTSEFGFQRGYDTFVESARTEDVLAWLQRAAGEPFFLHVHLLQPHGPYEAVEPYAEEFDPDYPRDAPYQEVAPIEDLWEARERPEAGFTDQELDRMRTLQASEIRGMDDEIAAIRSALEASGRWDETLVVVVADHGEEFQDHGSVGHAHTLYDELIRVPLLMRLQGRIPEDTRVTAQIELLDVAPTVLDLLGLPPLSAGRGASYAEHLDGGPPPEDADLAVSQLYELRGRQLVVARTLGWKLLVSTVRAHGEGRTDVSFSRSSPLDLVWGLNVQLFDLERDPRERTDVSAERPEVVAWLLERLELWRSEQGPVD